MKDEEQPVIVANAGASATVAPRTRLSIALLVVYCVLVAWVFYEQATAWPHVGSWGYILLFLLCPGIVFQSFSLAFMRRTGRPLKRRALTRLATIPLGLVVAALLASWAETLSQRGFEQAYAPFVLQVGANLPDPCRAAGSYFQASSVAGYNLRTGRGQSAAKLHHGGGRFVLAFPGGSADIDGSTIYYDSGAGTWRKFHNNDSGASAAYEKLRAGLAECLVQAPSSS